MANIPRRQNKHETSLTGEENRYLIETCKKLTNNQKRDFLKSINLSWTGSKDELDERIENGLKSGSVPLDALLAELNRILPWWRFHAFLYTPPSVIPKLWRNRGDVNLHLKQHRVRRLLNAHIPLVLPTKMTLTSIDYSIERLKITAVQRREYRERNEDLDPSDDQIESIIRGSNRRLQRAHSSKTTDDSDTNDFQELLTDSIEYRAFVRHVARGLVSLEWDFRENTAIIQITELPRGTKYEAIRDSFLALIQPWFSFDGFRLVNVSKSISALHESEKNDEREVRSHGIEYRTITGRRLAARSPAITTPVLGEDVIDDSLDRIREEGVGYSGNFYWLPTTEGDGSTTELEREIHVIILGDKNRVSLKTRSTTQVTEQEMRHVLSRLRKLSQ